MGRGTGNQGTAREWFTFHDGKLPRPIDNRIWLNFGETRLSLALSGSKSYKPRVRWEGLTMRARLSEDIKTAMKSGDKKRLATLRLISAAIKDRDLSAGINQDGQPTGREQISDQDIVLLLQKMIRQRRESAETYRAAGREDLADQEIGEVAVIEPYLPRQMTDSEIQSAIEALIQETGAAGLKDMGRTMAILKERYAGTMDFAKASAALKAALT